MIAYLMNPRLPNLFAMHQNDTIVEAHGYFDLKTKK
jgi:hypothetical protein